MRVAILGATSHIAKNMAAHLSLCPAIELVLFARAPASVSAFLTSNGILQTKVRSRSISDFQERGDKYDAIVNCIGFGTPERIRSAGWRLFETTEYFDNLIMDKIGSQQGTVYVNFSSGAVYGRNRNHPIDKDEPVRIVPDRLGEADAYAIAKLNSEAKHRAAKELSIIDLRVFGFFSRYIDLSSAYLLSEMTRAVQDDKVFVTDYSNITRDFVAPTNLASLVLRSIASGGQNIALDVYSREATTKRELVALFSERYGLRVEYQSLENRESPTGTKDCYYSVNHAATALINYEPSLTSREAIVIETDAILRK